MSVLSFFYCFNGCFVISDVFLHLVFDFVNEFLKFVFLHADALVFEDFGDFFTSVGAFFGSHEKTDGCAGNSTADH